MNIKNIFLVLSLIFLLTSSTLACDFVFNYEMIKAPLGTVGEIGVRIYRTHNNCTLKTMDEYYFTSDKIQILKETEWKEVEKNIYEKWLTVLLSEKGEGYLLIWKDCSKEGYDEKSLLIVIEDDSEEVKAALNSNYPYEYDGNLSIISGQPELDEKRLKIKDITLNSTDEEIPEKIFKTLIDYEKPVIVYYDSTNDNQLLLIAGEDIYYRFDQER